MTLQRYIDLGWEILEHKFRYYYGPEYGIEPVPDRIFDAVEDEYRHLAAQLNMPTSAADMVGFNEDLPSCRLVKEFLLAHRGKSPKDLLRKEAVLPRIVEGANLL